MRDSDGGPAPTATPLLVECLAPERSRIDGTLGELATARAVLGEVIAAAVTDGAAPDRDSDQAVPPTRGE